MVQMIVQCAHRKLINSPPSIPDVSRAVYSSTKKAYWVSRGRDCKISIRIKQNQWKQSSHALWDAAWASLVLQLIIICKPSCRTGMRRLRAIIKKAVRYGFLPNYRSFQSTDQSLFQSVIRNPLGAQHQLLPPVNISGYTLRSQSHQYYPGNHIHFYRKRISSTECLILTFTDI